MNLEHRMIVVLRDLRAESGMTMREVQKRSGIGWRTLGHYETGARKPLIPNLHRILAAYGVTLDEFFTLCKEAEKSPLRDWWKRSRRCASCWHTWVNHNHEWKGGPCYHSGMTGICDCGRFRMAEAT